MYVVFSDSQALNTKEELEKARVLTSVYGAVTGVCLAFFFLIVLFITYCYYKSYPYGNKKREPGKSLAVAWSHMKFFLWNSTIYICTFFLWYHLKDIKLNCMNSEIAKNICTYIFWNPPLKIQTHRKNSKTACIYYCIFYIDHPGSKAVIEVCLLFCLQKHIWKNRYTEILILDHQFNIK